MSHKQRSTAFNIITTLITKFTLLFGGFFVSILLARLLGPEGKGIITAVFVFPLLMVSLADMGIRQATAYYVGKGEHKLSEIISSIAFLWIITSASSILIVLVYFLLGPSDQYAWIILLVALASIPIKLIEQYAKGIMLGKNRISTINISQLLRLAANILSVLLLVWLFDLGVLGAALVQIIMALTIAIYYLIKVTNYHKIKFKPVSPLPKLLFMRGFGFAAALFIINLNYKIDIMILDRLVSAEEIGLYSVGVNFAELLWQIPSAVGMVLFAKSTTSKNQVDAVERSTAILRLVLPIMVISSIFIAVFAPYVIRILYGIDFIESGNILRILLPGICFITVSKILHPDLAGRGYPLFALRVFILTLLINILLNFLFIPTYGVNGAAFASTISYIVSGIGFGYVYSRKERIPMSNIFIIKRSDISRVKGIILKKVS
ncbi:oligosaccharide flippase family protein [Salipaludibacillus aurantiacus]|uniref:Membrane protein involved in the export of O-antigen and teichoic acid n=1 Tax=Salipaludibacillus aurantiacus TaxID=1601833 RepID=A0A1H9X9U7_9BACI|nr:oligosaccharide flippase family protein [Salipaludibacillus aurantiacus]SES42894.1 Membrane protein involved in the export of O-antigen and teichoic acid [Salipaludibacillus aurantiacus]